MRKAVYYILAALVCFIVFTIFVSTGVGVIILVIAWQFIITPIWKGITGLAEKDEKTETEEGTEEND